ncbi:phosphosulfolactate phosphohydrolase-like enzyme [Xenococcus sp. PCC 7305]|uniref:2-phosphosulfolactate phosphatase family protein n=1 Tax=Xenococcus sp. PCC 7305 TaxID=102125 RepID=UPI0002ABD71D|nr:2-phosphosulfolactate phosphatase family protein [Xenococcus sp. PCC 7305]ELS02514.1 phosphosulfolactate phosphohydrolase-like enzyme [Xenococcus sp. PCC 7305]
MKLFIYHTPEATPSNSLPDCAVVIDVLRATTTIATALNAGAEAVQAFSDIDLLMAKSDQWPPEKRLRAGERGGKKVEGFDLGNSPLNCTTDVVNQKRLFLTTTNGTRALQRVQQADTVITAAQINRQAVVNYLLEKQPEIIWLVGSGWQGTYSVEDTACAGAIVDSLLQQASVSLLEIAGNDEVIGALSLYHQWQDNLLSVFRQCSHGQRLLNLDCDADIEYCSRTDIMDIVPIQKEPGVLVKG